MAKKAEARKKLSGREFNKLACGGRKPGAPKTFESGQMFLNLFEEFLLMVKAFGFSEMPTRANFIFWLKTSKGIPCDYSKIDLTINEYYPSIKRIYLQMLEDALSEGAALDKYKPNMIIFCLKNWCGWTDKQETALSNKDDKAFRIELDAQLSDWSKQQIEVFKAFIDRHSKEVTVMGLLLKLSCVVDSTES